MSRVFDSERVYSWRVVTRQRLDVNAFCLTFYKLAKLGSRKQNVGCLYREKKEHIVPRHMFLELLPYTCVQNA